jgi:Na+-transporting methylmalonyl-CoA/oxaloacetate decarboxylase gamma subunit
VESGFAQPLWITLLGMAVTFAALALVMVTMVLLTRVVRGGRPSSEGPSRELPEESAHEAAAAPLPPSDEPAAAAGPAPVDLELPAGVEMAEVLAAVVAVATARELARQRYSARVWLSPQPRSLVSPWQLVARGRQMDRSRR